MTRGTKRGHDGSQSKDKYDGSKRGYQPWEVKVNLRCLGNLVWEKTFEGTEISLEGVAAGGHGAGEEPLGRGQVKRGALDAVTSQIKTASHSSSRWDGRGS